MHEAAQEHYTPAMKYSQLLATVYKRLAENWGAPAPWEECLAFGRSISDWQPFPDSAGRAAIPEGPLPALPALERGQRELRAFRTRKLDVQFDGIMTAEDIGSYKPSLRNFEYMLERLASQGIRREQILHVAQSLLHDHAPANELGLASCWIDRHHAKSGGGATVVPGNPPRYDFRFDSMREFAEAHPEGACELAHERCGRDLKRCASSASPALRCPPRWRHPSPAARRQPACL